MSDGTIKMFAYLVLLYDPRPHPLLCVEEPKNQLYPKLMAIVVKANILSLCAKAEKPDVLVRIACRDSKVVISPTLQRWRMAWSFPGLPNTKVNKNIVAPIISARLPASLQG